LFHRFTERARRSIFFARYEASQFGTSEITSDELLLGILREDQAVALLLGVGNLESIRKEIERLRPNRERIPTSVDMPLSKECQRILAMAVEEADGLHHRSIGAPHLVLGLLRAEESMGAQLLRKLGVEYLRYRTLVEQASLEKTAETTRDDSTGAPLV
jgi:ATP-dependent Clp protease ATP-binding subunit ClpC